MQEIAFLNLKKKSLDNKLLLFWWIAFTQSTFEIIFFYPFNKDIIVQKHRININASSTFTLMQFLLINKRTKGKS